MAIEKTDDILLALLFVLLFAWLTPLSQCCQPERSRPTIEPSSRAAARLIGSFDHSQPHDGITKVEDKIYVLHNRPYYRVRVYGDQIGFRFIKDISLSSEYWVTDIVYSKESQRVYIADGSKRCILVMTTTGEHRLTKWPIDVTRPATLAWSNEGHLLVLRASEPFSALERNSLEIYSLNAELIRTFYLPPDVKYPWHVVHTSAGNFIVSHRLNNATSGPWVVSQLTSEGRLINRFNPRKQSEILQYPVHMALDSYNNRLFVADFNNHRVISLDSNDLTWSKVIVSREKNGLGTPWRLFYDANDKQLIVMQGNIYNITVYEV